MTVAEHGSGTPSPLPAVSLFSNCGAGDFGFAAAGFRFDVMAELVESRLAVALRNHSGARAVAGDLRQTWERVIQEWRRSSGVASPTLVAACPPCQGMSTARRDRGKEADPEAGSRDSRNLLVLPIAHVVQELAPTFVVVENVPAFLRRQVLNPATGEGISAASLLIRSLDDDYRVYPFLCDLADYGVPQTRKRAFLTFVRRGSPAELSLVGSGSSPYPVPTHAPDHGGEPTSLGTALANFDLPPLDSKCESSARDATRPLHFVPVWGERQYQMVAAVLAGSGGSAWENDECATCGRVELGDEDAACPMCGEAVLRPVVYEDGEPRLVRGFRRSSYRRMDRDSPAATITTASGRVSSSRTLHPSQNRVFSPLECALLQTIPQGFDWGTALSERGVMELRAMIGEAVPPCFTELHGAVLTGLIRSPSRDMISADDRRCRAATAKLPKNA